jgi:hypothetical protein
VYVSPQHVDDEAHPMNIKLENNMDAIENMGYAKHLQQRYDERAVRKKNCSLR